MRATCVKQGIYGQRPWQQALYKYCQYYVISSSTGNKYHASTTVSYHDQQCRSAVGGPSCYLCVKQGVDDQRPGRRKGRGLGRSTSRGTRRPSYKIMEREQGAVPSLVPTPTPVTLILPQSKAFPCFDDPSSTQFSCLAVSYSVDSTSPSSTYFLIANYRRARTSPSPSVLACSPFTKVKKCARFSGYRLVLNERLRLFRG